MKKNFVISFLCIVLAFSLLSCKKDKVSESADNTPISMTFTSATVTRHGSGSFPDYSISFKGDGCSASFSYTDGYSSSGGSFSYNSDPSYAFTWHSGSFSCKEGSGRLNGGDLQISSNGASFSCTSNGRSVSGSYSGRVSLPSGSGGGLAK